MTTDFQPGDTKLILLRKIQERMITIGLTNSNEEDIRPGDTFVAAWRKILEQLPV
jgi:hypothetical protein